MKAVRNGFSDPEHKQGCIRTYSFPLDLRKKEKSIFCYWHGLCCPSMIEQVKPGTFISIYLKYNISYCILFYTVFISCMS